MGPRGIEKITLYDVGFVVCRDAQSRQAPSIQGLFHDVIDNITKIFKDSDVKWILIRDNKEVSVPFDEWVAYGRSLKKTVVETKPVDINTIKIIGCPKEHLQDDDQSTIHE